MKKFAILLSLLAIGLMLAACTVTPTAAPDQTTPKAAVDVATEAAAAVDPQPTADPAGYPAPSEPVQVVNAPGYPNPLPEGALFQLSLPDGSQVFPNEADLTGLAPVEITAEGQTRSGYRLLDLLAQRGVSEIRSLDVRGPNASATLSAEQIDDQVILELADGPAVNLIGANLESTLWVAPVTLLLVQ